MDFLGSSHSSFLDCVVLGHLARACSVYAAHRLRVRTFREACRVLCDGAVSLFFPGPYHDTDLYPCLFPDDGPFHHRTSDLSGPSRRLCCDRGSHLYPYVGPSLALENGPRGASPYPGHDHDYSVCLRLLGALFAHRRKGHPRRCPRPVAFSELGSSLDAHRTSAVGICGAARG